MYFSCAWSMGRGRYVIDLTASGLSKLAIRETSSDRLKSHCGSYAVSPGSHSVSNVGPGFNHTLCWYWISTTGPAEIPGISVGLGVGGRVGVGKGVGVGVEVGPGVDVGIGVKSGLGTGVGLSGGVGVGDATGVAVALGNAISLPTNLDIVVAVRMVGFGVAVAPNGGAIVGAVVGLGTGVETEGTGVLVGKAATTWPAESSFPPPPLPLAANTPPIAPAATTTRPTATKARR